MDGYRTLTRKTEESHQKVQTRLEAYDGTIIELVKKIAQLEAKLNDTIEAHEAHKKQWDDFYNN